MPIYFKSCQRCHGDVAELSDMYGDYLGCLQCGYLPLTVPSERRKSNGVSIDGCVEALWSLQVNRIISKAALSADPNGTFLEEHLEGMIKYGYVEMSPPKGKGRKKEVYFKLGEKGKEFIDAYKGLVMTVLEHQRINDIKNIRISSYELVDEDGKLTSIGKYFVQASPIIAQFVDDIYPMATISLESLETMQEESHEERQQAFAKLL